MSAALPAQVQQIFREEFRRLMAVQQAGFTAMLSAMDGDGASHPLSGRRSRRIREEEEEEEEEEDWRPQRSRRKGGKRRSARSGHHEPLSPASDFTEVTELASNFDLTPKTPPGRRGRRQVMEEAVEEEETAEIHAKINQQFAPSMRNALTELNDLRAQQQQQQQPKFQRSNLTADKENGAFFPLLRVRPEEGSGQISSSSPRIVLPFPLLSINPSAATAVPATLLPPHLPAPPRGPIPLLHLPAPKPLVTPPSPRAHIPNLLPPHVVANFIRERRAQELASRKPLKIADSPRVEHDLRQRLGQPQPLLIPPLLTVEPPSSRGPPLGPFVPFASQRTEGPDSGRSWKATPRSARTLSERLEEREEEKEEVKEDSELQTEEAQSPKEKPKSYSRPRAVLDQGTVMCTDAGTQHDALSDEDEQKIIHQGYAITPGSIVQLDDKQVPILPPDILGNIRLDDQAGGDRRFLSVVSVDHGLWDELVGKEMAKIGDDEVKTLQKPPDLQRLRHFNRRAFAASPPSSPGPDALTQRILSSRPEEHEGEEGDSVAEYRRDTRSKMKASMTRTLVDMDARLRDITELHMKMEREYPNLQNLMDDVTALDADAKTRYPFLAPGHSARKEQSASHGRPEDKRQLQVTISEDLSVGGPAPVNSRSAPVSSRPAPDSEVLRLAEVVDVDEVLDTGCHRKQSPGRSARTGGFCDHRRPERKEKDSAEEREKLRQWLAERRSRQLAEYLQQRHQRIEAEAKPFRAEAGGEHEDVRALQRSRESRSRVMAEERESQARRLATEAMQELGLPASRNAHVPEKAPVTSGRRKGSGERRTARRAEAPPDEDEFKTYEEYDKYLDQMMELSSAATSEILKGKGPPSARAPPGPQQPPPELVEYRPPKRKPFTEIVRLQRPEATRKGTAKRPLNREEMFASLREVKGLVPKSAGPATNRTTRSFSGSVMSERRPGGGPMRRSGLSAERGPRTNVKTYAQRLQEAQPPKRPSAAGRAGPASHRAQPYHTPAAAYRSLDDEMTSILSDWSMSDDVKRILYGGANGGDAGRLSRTLDDINSQGLDFGSEQSDSVASFIDWDRVDEIVQNM